MRASDSNALTCEKPFSVTVADPRLAPSDILLSNTETDENMPEGTKIGVFSTVIPNPGDTHGYTLVIGEGDTDNDSFYISGDTLKAKGFLLTMKLRILTASVCRPMKEKAAHSKSSSPSL